MLQSNQLQHHDLQLCCSLISIVYLIDCINSNNSEWQEREKKKTTTEKWEGKKNLVFERQKTIRTTRWKKHDLSGVIVEIQVEINWTNRTLDYEKSLIFRGILKRTFHENYLPRGGPTRKTISARARVV